MMDEDGNGSLSRDEVTRFISLAENFGLHPEGVLGLGLYCVVFWGGASRNLPFLVHRGAARRSGSFAIPMTLRPFLVVLHPPHTHTHTTFFHPFF